MVGHETSTPGMSRRLLLGIDVGTTSAKAVIADADGALLAQAAQEYTTRYPQPGWAEQDPDDWWRAVCAVLRQIFAAGSIDPAGIAALCVPLFRIAELSSMRTESMLS